MHPVLAAVGGSELDLVLFGLLTGVALLLLLAYWTRVPYPILMVVGGAALGFVPWSPAVELEPDMVLVIFLPPLLYSAAFFSSLRDLRDNMRAIGLLAIGLVVFTTLSVGVLAHTVIPDLSWAAAFTLGAILSPTDPVAATAIASRSGAPQRFVTIVEGESLINDATALIAYKVAVGAVLTGTFSALDAGGEFLVNAAAGVAIGIAVGIVVARVRRAIEDAPTEITISLLTPYFAYLPAEALGVSAVLAAVTSGIWLGWRSPQLISPSTRIQAFSVWEILVFVLNAALFVLVGLQLRTVVERIADQYSAGELALYGAAVAGTVIAVRFVWVFPAAYLPRRLSGSLRAREAYPPVSQVFLVGWTGMRGAVSLAAALALPLAMEDGTPFPARDLIIFLTYVTILVTILGPGLTLGPLIRLLGMQDDGTLQRRELKARMKAARRAIERLDELLGEEWVREDSARRMRGLYEFRLRRFGARFDDEDDGAMEQGSLAYQRLRREVLEAERAEIVRLRNQGFINDAVLHRIERDLDLEDARLEIPAGGPPQLGRRDGDGS